MLAPFRTGRTFENVQLRKIAIGATLLGALSLEIEGILFAFGALGVPWSYTGITVRVAGLARARLLVPVLAVGAGRDAVTGLEDEVVTGRAVLALKIGITISAGNGTG